VVQDLAACLTLHQQEQHLVATVSGTSLTAGSAGTCLVTATKAASTNYLSASSIQTTVTFAKANSIFFTHSFSSTSGTYGTASNTNYVWWFWTAGSQLLYAVSDRNSFQWM
jgi:hypothetical protein